MARQRVDAVRCIANQRHARPHVPPCASARGREGGRHVAAQRGALSWKTVAARRGAGRGECERLAGGGATQGAQAGTKFITERGMHACRQAGLRLGPPACASVRGKDFGSSPTTSTTCKKHTQDAAKQLSSWPQPVQHSSGTAWAAGGSMRRRQEARLQQQRRRERCCTTCAACAVPQQAHLRRLQETCAAGRREDATQQGAQRGLGWVVGRPSERLSHCSRKVVARQRLQLRRHLLGRAGGQGRGWGPSVRD